VERQPFPLSPKYPEGLSLRSFKHNYCRLKHRISKARAQRPNPGPGHNLMRNVHPPNPPLIARLRLVGSLYQHTLIPAFAIIRCASEGPSTTETSTNNTPLCASRGSAPRHHQRCQKPECGQHLLICHVPRHPAKPPQSPSGVAIGSALFRIHKAG
jgi:hypothetical protein